LLLQSLRCWREALNLVRGSPKDRVRDIAHFVNIPAKDLILSAKVCNTLFTGPHETKQTKRPTIVSFFVEWEGW
jgi:hypothetical protein